MKNRPFLLYLDLVAHRPLASSQGVYTAADSVTNQMDFRWFELDEREKKRNRTTGDGFEHHRKQIPQMMRALQWKGRRSRMREMKYFELTIVVRCVPCLKGLWNRKSRRCLVFVKGLSVVFIKHRI